MIIKSTHLAANIKCVSGEYSPRKECYEFIQNEFMHVEYDEYVAFLHVKFHKTFLASQKNQSSINSCLSCSKVVCVRAEG